MAKKSTPLETLNKAIENAGGLTKTAIAMGVTPQAVQNWRARGVPARSVNRLAELGGVQARLLRPDMFS